MAVNFPTSLDTTTQLPTESASTPLATNHVVAHTNLALAIIALETKLGVDSSAVTTTHDYKLSGVAGSDKAASKTGTETLTNKTLTSPVINVSSDATGDVYYRNSGGLFTRLGIGSTNQVLTVIAGIPSWQTPTAIVNASQTVKGIVEIATAAEITAGTATGGTGAILAISPDQLALSTPVFDGSGLTNIGIHTNGTTTKDISDASGTQNIAHGLGKTPKWIRIVALGFPVSVTALRGVPRSESIYNGTTQSSSSFWFSNDIPIADNSFKLGGTAGGGGNLYQSGVITFDATNITITWTKAGSPTGTYQILWEAHY